MFDFFVEQILGMQWLSDLVWCVLINYFHAEQNSNWWSSAHFFFYDTIKITILLVTLIYLISYIQSYFPPEKTKRILTHFDGFTGNIIAALLGTVTPFCSCSSVPIFIGFTRAGLPVGMTFSFLISSPMVDVVSILMLMSFFGPEFAIFYTVVGVILAVVGGKVLSMMHAERYLKNMMKQLEIFTLNQNLLIKDKD